MTRLATASLAAFALAALAPAAAWACAVCVGSEQESRRAFIWTTVLLSALPPGMIGALVLFLWRRSRAQQAPGASARGRLAAPLSNAG